MLQAKPRQLRPVLFQRPAAVLAAAVKVINKTGSRQKAKGEKIRFAFLPFASYLN